MVKHPEDYEYCNYRQYAMGEDRFDGLFDFHPAYLRLGKEAEERQKSFLS